MNKKKVGKYIGRFFLVLLTLIVALVANLLIMISMFVKGPSVTARELFATTILETGQVKFLASWFMSEEEIEEAIAHNKLVTMEEEVNTDLIQISVAENGENADAEDQEPIVIDEISGRTFFAKMMIVKDPSKVFIGTIYPWGEYGKELGEIVEEQNAIAGVNGGLYVSTGNSGGRPMGLVVSKGEIQNRAQSQSIAGLYLIGFTEDDILLIKSIAGMSDSDVEKMVKEEKIRDAICFQEESSDANNHFVPLIINGETRKSDGLGSGANPRTAIGQRADGAVLILVTDGRGASGHLGATATDLIQIMEDYGAVNAANIDGGSSSSMYYNGNYEMTSVTFYYANSSWRLPTAFCVAE